jgi:hypothetical protein
MLLLPHQGADRSEPVSQFVVREWLVDDKVGTGARKQQGCTPAAEV